MRRISSVEVVLGLAAVLAVGEMAGAHAFLDHAEPKVGAEVKVSPTEVKIWFTEAIEPAFSKMQVLDAAGKQVDKGDFHLDAKDKKLGIVSLPALAAGKYKVVWQAVAADTHKTQGDFTFTVLAGGGGATRAAATAAARAVREGGAAAGVVGVRWASLEERGVMFWLFAATRTIHFCACLLMLGVWVFDRGVVAPGGRGAGETAQAWVMWRKIAGRLWLAAWVAALVSGALWYLLVCAAMSGDTLLQSLGREVLSTVWSETLFGTVWKWRLVGWAALAAAGVALFCLRLRPWVDGVVAWVALMVAGFFLASLAWAGHGLIGSWWHQAADVVHLLVSGCWAGGLVPLILMLRALRRMPEGEGGAFAGPMVGRFSRMSMVCVALLAGTGIVNGWVLVGRVGALFSTAYGLALVAKVILFCVIVGVGAGNRGLVKKHSSAGLDGGQGAGELLGRLPRKVAWEVVLVMAIVVIVGFLGMVPPPGR